MMPKVVIETKWSLLWRSLTPLITSGSSVAGLAQANPSGLAGALVRTATQQTVGRPRTIGA